MLACAGSARCTRWCSAGLRRGARHPDRRRRTEGHRFGVLRHRGQAGHRVQAVVGQRDRAGLVQAAALSCSARRPGHHWARPTSTGWPRRAPPRRPTTCRKATDPLSTSSTRPARPRGLQSVVRDSGGYAVALRWSMPSVYDVNAGETMFSASDVGWVVGHLTLSTQLLLAATTVLYEDKLSRAPDAGQFLASRGRTRRKDHVQWRRRRSAIKKEDPNGEFTARYDLSTLNVPVPCR